MSKLTRAVLARIAALRAESAGGWSATSRWKRYAAATVPLLLAGALAVTVVLTSDARTQPTSAGQTATPPAEPQQQAAATPQPAHPAPSTTVTIPSTERQQCVDGAALAAHPDNPALADDCALLLAAKDTLRGTATLNWSATTAITSWTGVTLETVEGASRVTLLNLERQGINGTLPAALGRLTGLRELRLSWRNQLTGAIPPELGSLNRLTYLGLAGNHLSGPIPPELGAIGPQLTGLILSGPRPLPEAVGLSGAIPAQLGNLTGLNNLYLDGNRLTGSIPARLGRLQNLHWLHLARNQLSGSIPTQLGALANLNNLRLEHNRLTGALPTQLTALSSLSRLYVQGNSGLSGCVPPALRRIETNDLAQLNLPDCAADAPDTPVTPLPTYTLTATAGEGGSVEPTGMTTQVEGEPVTLTASWNDATHTFAAWGGECSGTATTCILELYSDKTVTATFTALPADRCATTTDASCIRAVYLGAPNDYAQVQDIPAELLLAPDDDGRYQVERGQQITVVTAAPLPADYTRFYLQRQPLQVTVSPTSAQQLIPPVGTTYTFTVAANEAGSNLITFNLTEARPRPLPRPGQKPELGDVVVTTNFLVPTLRYDTLDITGAATTPGSYAFLKTAGDASSAIDNFASSAQVGVELRIHPTDASGTSRTAFYDTVEVGDRFDYQTDGIRCAFRFTVTGVGETASPKTFGIELVNGYGGACGPLIDDPSTARDVNFVWAPPYGRPLEHGIRVMFYLEAHGPGTYRLEEGLPFIIDVPPGSEVIHQALYLVERDDDALPGFSDYVSVLLDAKTGSYLGIDPITGRETHRVTTSPDADALFDQIMASMRRVD